MDFYQFESPIGTISVSGEKNELTGVYLPGMPTPRSASKETPVRKMAEHQILEYLNGDRREFEIPYLFNGTAFQNAVWKKIVHIPYGSMVTYKDVAKAIGRPAAYQAVGNALHDNPLPLILPCHRVVGQKGELGGYVAGEELKYRLLVLEGL